MPRLVAAEMVPGPKKEMNLISATSCTKKAILITECLICEIETSTAKLHDSQVDLSTEGEVVLRDRVISGCRLKANDYGLRFQPLSALHIEKYRNHLNLAEAV